MKVSGTTLPGALLIEPDAHGDSRGFFAETYRADVLAEAGVLEAFVQDNHSRSGFGVVRGIHFAVGDGSAKLVRCARGSIWDVIVDLRCGSPTYGAWEGFDLTDENLRVLYIPRGFGHGFCVTSDVADVVYKQSDYYDPDLEKGIAWDDPEVGIKWPIAADQVIASERDLGAPTLAEVADDLPFELD